MPVEHYADSWVRLLHQDDAGRPLPGAPEFPSILRLRRHFASPSWVWRSRPGDLRAFERRPATRYGYLVFDDLAPNVTAPAQWAWNAEPIDPGRRDAAQMRRHLTHGII